MQHTLDCQIVYCEMRFGLFCIAQNAELSLIHNTNTGTHFYFNHKNGRIYPDKKPKIITSISREKIVLDAIPWREVKVGKYYLSLEKGGAELWGFVFKVVREGYKKGHRTIWIRTKRRGSVEECFEYDFSEKGLIVIPIKNKDFLKE